MRRIALLLVLALVALGLAACTERMPTAEELVSRMEDARATTTSAEATIDVHVESPEGDGALTVQGWMEQIDPSAATGHPNVRMRAEVTAASEPKLVGSTMVSDGTTFWLYHPTENMVVTGELAEIKELAHSQRSSSPPMLNDLVAQGLDAVELTVLGIEQVAGQATWKVEVTPRPETSARLPLEGLVRATLWVDEALALPLKLEVNASDLGQGRIEVRDLVVNQPIDAAHFSFAIPEGATVLQAAELIAKAQEQHAASLDEARTSVSFHLREPSYLPHGVSLVEVRVVGTSTVIMNYVGEQVSLSIVQSNEAMIGNEREAPLGSLSEAVMINGAEATMITNSQTQGSMLRWEANGIRYIIAGPLPPQEALRVAEGLR
ncbi:DUF4367 domain-containing protein [Candidatus Viridilinea mediisalina]|nr:DUF4367 domain-containing protein [Candidatus Viridilinea mediisalina]